MNDKNYNNYNASNIQVLEGLEAVRKRPGMYIGNTSFSGLHHLIWELLDNAIDEALAGYCDLITIIINKNNSVTVIDNGRGIPIDIVKKTGKSAVETVYTLLHAGGKFGGNNSGYKISGGLHGVGASVVNALSEWLEVNVFRNNSHYYLKFEDGGKVVGELTKIGNTSLTGTSVTFKPDIKIFTEGINFDYKTIYNHIRQMAYLNKSVKFILKDERNNISDEFYYKGGLIEYIKFLNQNKTLLMEEVFYCDDNEEIKLFDNEAVKIYVEIALQYNNSYNSLILSFCNNINTNEGGTHEEGFRLALNRVINDYARKFNFLEKNRENFTTDDIKEGLVAIISIKHPNPQYEGQTKTKLGNTEVRKIVSGIFGKKLMNFLLENPQISKAILTKINNASEARIAARKAQESIRRKNSLDVSTLPGKLVDCQSSNFEECELFIVEGTSAGGSAKAARDRRIQAVLPLRGKILNIEKKSKEHAFNNAEIGNMITAIGAGVDPEFDLSKIRYNKIIIMTDADVDGAHIQILLLTFFFRFMRNLVTDGHVYIAVPPLYRIDYKQKIYYCYNDIQLEEIKKKLQLKSSYPYTRFKGLGEMNPDQLFETTMSLKTRKLLKVNVEDVIKADQVFNSLMGQDVIPRKKFIYENAKFVKNIDI